MAVTKSRKRSDFVSYSYFKDSGFTEVKRDGKSQTNNVKGVPFVNRRCSKGVPFQSKMVNKSVRGLTFGWNLPL